MKTVLDIENVSKSYKLGKIEVPVLNDINLTVNEGEFAAIMGHSGSGKSTLMNLIGCLDRPTSGRIIIAGRQEISKYLIKSIVRRTILMVTHDRELVDNCDRIIRLKDGKIETGG